jgi:hypothetical protein
MAWASGDEGHRHPHSQQARLGLTGTGGAKKWRGFEGKDLGEQRIDRPGKSSEAPRHPHPQQHGGPDGKWVVPVIRWGCCRRTGAVDGEECYIGH